MKKFLLAAFLIATITGTFAQTDTLKISKIIDKTSISGHWFLGNSYNDKTEVNSFLLKRGYFTVKTKLNETLYVRYTQDITLDDEGDDAGNVEIRIKYLYMKMKLDKIDFLENTYFEFGLVHRPWLDYEQSINAYRAQGKMFAERYKTISSADFGMLYTGLIGGKINDNYQKSVNSKSPGKYGSFSIGIFNGAGYHGFEANNNKMLEGRLSLRPFPTVVPGLQFSYAFAYGQANTTTEDDFRMNLFFVSSESKYHVLTAQYYFGVGNYSGSALDTPPDSDTNSGYSLFGEFKIPKTKFAVFGRYDNFTTAHDYETIIAGVSYRFLKNKLLLDYDRFTKENDVVNTVELILEIKF